MAWWEGVLLWHQCRFLVRQSATCSTICRTWGIACCFSLNSASANVYGWLSIVISSSWPISALLRGKMDVQLTRSPQPFWWWCFLNFQGDVAVCNWLSWYILVVCRIWSHVCLCFLQITTFSCLAPEILLYVSGIGGGSVVLVSARSICFSCLKWPPVKMNTSS